MESSPAERWNQRYATTEYVFGTTPNDFLVSVADRLPRGRALCLGEGEGRNAVFLAGLGHLVTAVDASSVGLQKAERLAAQRGVRIRAVLADLAEYVIEPESWDVLVLIFLHLPPELRRRVHAAAVRGLRPGGALVLEAYTPEQLELQTGGPPDGALLMQLDALRDELRGLELRIARELRREIHEGTHHHGVSSVVQVLGWKPSGANDPEALL